MAKIRVCPKCGKTESQFTFFCTECGWKTETQEIQNDYSTVKVMEKNEIHIQKNTSSIETMVDSQEKTMPEVIRDSYPNKRDDAFKKLDRDEEIFKILRSEEICKPESTVFAEDPDEYYIDLICPHCQEQLSYMNWQLREPLVCPMCNTNFRYDERFKNTEILDDCTSEIDEYVVSCTTEPQEDYPIVENRRFDNVKEYTLDMDSNETEDIELDGTFVDIVCPHCSSQLSFLDWQIEEEELICPICENTFTVK